MPVKQPSMKVGDTFYTKQGNVEVIDYKNASQVVVRFKETGTIVKAKSCHIREGLVKDRLHRSVAGVGYLGEGIFKPKVNGETLISYIEWEKLINNTYQYGKAKYGYTVCDKWQNLQNFCVDFDAMPNKYVGWFIYYHASNDLKVIGPDTTYFLPFPILNTLRNRIGHRGTRSSGAIGVNETSKKKPTHYQPSIVVGNKRVVLPVNYPTKQEAIAAGKIHRKEYITAWAKDNKAMLHPKLYTYLVRWQPLY